MIAITLADKSKKQFDAPVTVHDVVAAIGPGLAKAALAAKVDGHLVDLSYLIESDVTIQIITDRDLEGLEIIRHSTAHLLAHAVKTLFPNAQVTIGPVIDDGFYYDFSFERSFTPEDLTRIEEAMRTLAKADYPVERRVLSREQAIKIFAEQGEAYKVEIIKDIPSGETLTAYQQDGFIDLCRGPHVPRTGLLKVFKLTKLAGAYWRGDSNNEMLQRIYGTAWPDKKSLNDYLTRLEEMEKRDHRKLGKQMDLFHFQQEAPGMAFWHGNGWQIVRLIREYLRDTLTPGYQEVNTPQMLDIGLWQQSGHFEKFHQEMFHLHLESRDYAIKPMGCPCHVQIFKQGLKSYRDLPLRLSEFGCCHRNEHSGTLHGLMRVRAMVQDDGHIFCTEDQIHEEVLAFIQQIHNAYRDFGFTDIIYKLSTRPENRVGSDAIWDKAEKALAEALDVSGVDWEILPGEGAFYGPKIEFSLKDCMGRVWQCGTMQVDFNLPVRLKAEYVTEAGNRQPPVMLHRAIIGTFERFIGILLEHYAGWLPLWLAPIQVVVMNISDAQAEYSAEIGKNLRNSGFRAATDLRNEKIGFKIRQHTIARIPYQLVIGDREVAGKTLAVRQETGESITMSVDQLSDRLRDEINRKLLRGG